MTPTRVRRLAPGLLVILAVTACSGGGTSAPSTSAASVSSDGSPNSSQETTTPAVSPTTTAPAVTTAPGLSTEDAVALLADFDPADPESNELVIRRGDPAVVAAAGDVLAAGGTPSQEWAAVYVWANEGDDAAPLLGYLDADDAAVRAMAAAGVLGRGSKEGFAPLIALLEDTDELAGSEPPVPAWSFAATMLASLTGVSDNGPPFDADDSQRAEAKQRWSAWLAEHDASLHFDETEGRWLG